MRHPSRREIALIAIAMLIAVFALAACSPQQSTPPSSRQQKASELMTTRETADASLSPLPAPSDFASEVTNPYYPLKPGMTWVYTGVKDGASTTDNITVTRNAKMVLGIRATVVKDILTAKGRVVESTEDWFAQDIAGNVWYLGEDTTTYKSDGSIESTSGSWQAGVDGAQAGIFMPAIPKVGQVFRQELYKGEAEDAFKILSLTAKTSVPYGAFSTAMRTAERTPLEPDVITEKFYVRGVGLVFENDVAGAQEYNRLVSFTGSTAASPTPGY